MYNIALYRRRAAAFPGLGHLAPDQNHETQHNMTTKQRSTRNIFRFHCTTTQISLKKVILLTIAVAVAVTTAVGCSVRCCCIFIVQSVSGVCSQPNVF